MNYLYLCTQCGNQVTINKPMSDSDRAEHFEVCESELKRVYEAVSVKTNDGFKK